jgi:hypothetical protein
LTVDTARPTQVRSGAGPFVPQFARDGHRAGDPRGTDPRGCGGSCGCLPRDREPGAARSLQREQPGARRGVGRCRGALVHAEPGGAVARHRPQRIGDLLRGRVRGPVVLRPVLPGSAAGHPGRDQRRRHAARVQRRFVTEGPRAVSAVRRGAARRRRTPAVLAREGRAAAAAGAVRRADSPERPPARPRHQALLRRCGQRRRRRDGDAAPARQRPDRST